MSEPINPATRPSRLSPLSQAIISLLLLAGFVSGVLIWWGKGLSPAPQPDELLTQTPAWLRTTIIIHGMLFPFQCGLFGWLACQHFKTSWQMRANLISGFLMEAVFLALILSGAALHYAGDWRDQLVWFHRISGVLLPLVIGFHWIAGLRWAKNLQNNP